MHQVWRSLSKQAGKIKETHTLKRSRRHCAYPRCVSDARIEKGQSSSQTLYPSRKSDFGNHKKRTCIKKHDSISRNNAITSLLLNYRGTIQFIIFFPGVQHGNTCWACFVFNFPECVSFILTVLRDSKIHPYFIKSWQFPTQQTNTRHAAPP